VQQLTNRKQNDSLYLQKRRKKMRKLTTKKEILSRTKPTIAIAYQEATFLLHYKRPQNFTQGIQGWNCDIYELDFCYVATGYRPFGFFLDRDKVYAFENKARQIIDNTSENTTQAQSKNEVEALLLELQQRILMENVEKLILENEEYCKRIGLYFLDSASFHALNPNFWCEMSEKVEKYFYQQLNSGDCNWEIPITGLLKILDTKFYLGQKEG
jgi:hypothetical protein